MISILYWEHQDQNGKSFWFSLEQQYSSCWIQLPILRTWRTFRYAIVTRCGKNTLKYLQCITKHDDVYSICAVCLDRFRHVHLVRGLFHRWRGALSSRWQALFPVIDLESQDSAPVTASCLSIIIFHAFGKYAFELFLIVSSSWLGSCSRTCWCQLMLHIGIMHNSYHVGISWRDRHLEEAKQRKTWVQYMVVNMQC